MTPGLTADLQDIIDARKTAVINDELLTLEVDIAGLQEIHLQDYMSLWQEHRENVGLVDRTPCYK